MPEYIVRFETVISLDVRVVAKDEDVAADDAWERAEDYLSTVYGEAKVNAHASLDGMGAESVTEVQPGRYV